MARFLRNHIRALSMGQAPGEPIFIGDQKMDAVTIRLIAFDNEHYVDKILPDLPSALSYKDAQAVTWINIYGLHDTEQIKEIGEAFGLHALTLEDIVNTGQQPKVEEHDDYLFFSLKMMRYDEGAEQVNSEQLSMILGENFLLTFQERPGDVFEPVRERIRRKRGRIRSAGVDYLTYTLLDTVIDNYFFIVESLGEKIEDLDAVVLETSAKDVLPQINNYKREMNYLRKTIRPVREFVFTVNTLGCRPFSGTNRTLPERLAGYCQSGHGCHRYLSRNAFRSVAHL